MSPEQILSALLAQTSQLDFGRPDPLIINASADKVGRARPRNWRVVYDDDGKIDPVKTWPRIHTALGKSRRSVSKLSMAEIASYAFIGMPQRNFQTLCTALRAQDGSRRAVKSRLIETAKALRDADDRWPKKLRRDICACGHAMSLDYTLDLAELAVRELEDPVMYSAHTTRAKWFGVSSATWYRVMRRPFDQLSGPLWGSFYAGVGHVYNRLNRPDRHAALP